MYTTAYTHFICTSMTGPFFMILTDCMYTDTHTTHNIIHPQSFKLISACRNQIDQSERKKENLSILEYVQKSSQYQKERKPMYLSMYSMYLSVRSRLLVTVNKSVKT